MKPSLSSRRDAVSRGKCPLTRDALCVLRAACARGPICDFRRFRVHAAVLPEQISSPSGLPERPFPRGRLYARLTKSIERHEARTTQKLNGAARSAGDKPRAFPFTLPLSFHWTLSSHRWLSRAVRRSSSSSARYSLPIRLSFEDRDRTTNRSSLIRFLQRTFVLR